MTPLRHTRALLVAGSPDADPGHVAALAPDFGLVIAVDSGADVCLAAGIQPGIVVGDLDSATGSAVARLENGRVRIDRHPTAKDLSDLDLAVDTLRESDIERVVATGVTGGRLDHSLAAIGSLAAAVDLWPAIDEPDLRGWFLGSAGRQSLRLAGTGATVSVFSVGGRGRASGRTRPGSGGAAGRALSTGLRWPLDGLELGPLSSHGLSNVIEDGVCRIQCKSGRLLVLSPRVDAASPARESEVD